MTSPAPGEKRSSPRTPVQLTAHCRLGNRYVREAVADLSVGGLFLKTREPVKEGTSVRVAVALPMHEGPRICTLVGQVARVHTDPRGLCAGLGVRFQAEEIASPDQRALSSFLGRDGQALTIPG